MAFYDRVRQLTATTGVADMVLGAAVARFRTVAFAGVANGEVVRYVIEDANGGWEINSGAYTSASSTLARGAPMSSSAASNAKITLSGNAIVTLLPSAVDFADFASLKGPTTFTGALTSKGNFGVEGTATFAGPTNISGVFTANNTATFNGAFNVGGISYFDKAVSMNATLTTAGALSVPSFGVSGNGTINGTLNVGAVGVGGQLTANGPISAQSTLAVQGTAGFAKAVTFYDGVAFNAVLYAKANNGFRQSISCGDDAWLGDANIAHAISVTSVTDPNQGKIVFGQSTATLGMIANDGYLRFQGEMLVDSWFRINNRNTGLFWELLGRGIVCADSGANYGNINTYGTGMNGWSGYSINTDMTMMSNLNDQRGLHSQRLGGWLVRWDNSRNATFEGSISQASDERIKQNIRPIDDVWNRYRGLEGITYERDGKTRIGVGAQTTRKVFPEVVHEADDLTKTLSVNYDDIEGATIAVVRMLMDGSERKDEQIDLLTDRVESQAALIEELTERMYALENKK